jgi:2-phosphoglycerate kinase
MDSGSGTITPSIRIVFSRNPELDQEEKDNVKGYMNKLIQKQKTLNKRYSLWRSIRSGVIISII